MDTLISTTRYLTRRLADAPPFDPETGGQYPFFEDFPFGANRETRRRFVNGCSKEQRQAITILLRQADDRAVAAAQEAYEKAAAAVPSGSKLVLPAGVEA